MSESERKKREEELVGEKIGEVVGGDTSAQEETEGSGARPKLCQTGGPLPKPGAQDTTYPPHAPAMSPNIFPSESQAPVSNSPSVMGRYVPVYGPPEGTEDLDWGSMGVVEEEKGECPRCGSEECVRVYDVEEGGGRRLRTVFCVNNPSPPQPFRDWEGLSEGKKYEVILSYYAGIGVGVDVTDLKSIKECIDVGVYPDREGKFRPSSPPHAPAMPPPAPLSPDIPKGGCCPVCGSRYDTVVRDGRSNVYICQRCENIWTDPSVGHTSPGHTYPDYPVPDPSFVGSVKVSDLPDGDDSSLDTEGGEGSKAVLGDYVVRERALGDVTDREKEEIVGNISPVSSVPRTPLPTTDIFSKCEKCGEERPLYKCGKAICGIEMCVACIIGEFQICCIGCAKD